VSENTKLFWDSSFQRKLESREVADIAGITGLPLASVSENKNYLRIHHSNVNWNPDKLLLSWSLLDSIFRWNDEVSVNIFILEQTF